jgi:hypothetical protein
MIDGMSIVASPLARDIRTVWKVERHPIPKRRKQWCVVKSTIDQPGMYIIGMTAFVHPDLVEKLKSQEIRHG